MEFQTVPIRSLAMALFLFCALVVGSCCQCLAALGNDISSLPADQAHLHATLQSTPRAAYVQHELRAASGLVIHEYSAPNGKIFAVAWEGPVIPDLRQILGAHFEDFRRAAEVQNRRDVRGPLFIQQNGLTVELGGHMRSYRGKAYLSDDVPESVRVEELR